MKFFLDNLFLLGQVICVAGIAWGAWMVLRESLAGVIFPAHKESARTAVGPEHVMRPSNASLASHTHETRRAA